MRSETVWAFRTKHFRVALKIEPDYGYRYDGETQAKLDSGEYVAFDSHVVVYLSGEEVARDELGGSVYEAGAVSDFWAAHRGDDPANRNCLENVYRVGHYFPDMVRQACEAARTFLSDLPVVRKAA